MEQNISRNIKNNTELRDIFRRPLYLAERVRLQRLWRSGKKVYSHHAQAVESTSKGKAHRAYEFGVNVSVVTSLRRLADGEFVAHIKSQPRVPYGVYTLAVMIPEMEEHLGTTINWSIADHGNCGHETPLTHQFKVYIAGQKRLITDAIGRGLPRLSLQLGT